MYGIFTVVYVKRRLALRLEKTWLELFNLPKMLRSHLVAHRHQVLEGIGLIWQVGDLASRLASNTTASTSTSLPSVNPSKHSTTSHRNAFSTSELGRSVDHKEASKFAALSSQWWDPAGPFGPLHRLNPARCKFIRSSICSAKALDRNQAEALQSLSILDVGCGGGMLSESMARMGASVHGIDITEENVHAARQHAALDPALKQRIRYECNSAEALAETRAQYDVVLASEVIEHVKRPDQFVSTLATLLKPEGLLIMSTINRTPQSYAVAIVAAEYVTGIVPRGTHDWRRFITPDELTIMAQEVGLHLRQIAGMSIRLDGTMYLSEDLTINYIASFQSAPAPAAVAVGPTTPTASEQTRAPWSS